MIAFKLVLESNLGRISHRRLKRLNKAKIISTNADKDIDGVTEAISYSIENEKL